MCGARAEAASRCGVRPPCVEDVSLFVLRAGWCSAQAEYADTYAGAPLGEVLVEWCAVCHNALVGTRGVEHVQASVRFVPEGDAQVGVVQPVLGGDDGDDVAVADGTEFALSCGECLLGEIVSVRAVAFLLHTGDFGQPFGVEGEHAVLIGMACHVVVAYGHGRGPVLLVGDFAYDACAYVVLHPPGEVVEAGQVALAALVAVADELEHGAVVVKGAQAFAACERECAGRLHEGGAVQSAHVHYNAFRVGHFECVGHVGLSQELAGVEEYVVTLRLGGEEAFHACGVLGRVEGDAAQVVRRAESASARVADHAGAVQRLRTAGGSEQCGKGECGEEGWFHSYAYRWFDVCDGEVSTFRRTGQGRGG